MLENGEKYSHFKNLPKFDIEEKLNLNGIIVRIKYLKNNSYKKFQTEKHLNWWVDFFNYSNAVGITIDQW